MKLLAIIPAYNEAGTIGDVIWRIKKHQPSMDILVVNDGSADKTSEAARQTGAASVLELPFNLGIGGAVQAGYQYACKKNYDLAVQKDADGQHDPAELERILSPVMEGTADCCIGSRFLEKRGYRSTLFRRFGIRYFAWMIRSTMRSRLTDPTSGFRAVGRKGIRVFAGYYPDDYPEVEAVWLLLGLAMALFLFAPGLLDRLSRLLRVHYAPSLLFLLGLLFSLAFIMHLTIVMSRMHRRIVRLAQEVAILKEELEHTGGDAILTVKGGAAHG
ncbi:Undecaprenyl-phosphate mannosyltransferase [compost metagenome]